MWDDVPPYHRTAEQEWYRQQERERERDYYRRRNYHDSQTRFERDMMDRDHRQRTDQWLYNPPIDINWDGFRSDTYTLSRAGWRFRVNESHRVDMDCHQITLIMEHPQRQVLSMSYGLMFSHQDVDRLQFGRHAGPFPKFFDMQGMGSDIVLEINNRQAAEFRPTAWLETDMVPHVEERQRVSMRDLNLFKSSSPKPILLEEHDATDLMSMILEKQQDKKMKFLRKSIAEEPERTQFHGNIISLRSA